MRHAALVRHRIHHVTAALDAEPAVLDYWVETTRGVGHVVTIETGDRDALEVWQKIVEAAALIA